MTDEVLARGSPQPRWLAIVAFLTAATALLLPWWSITHTTQGLPLRDHVGVFRPEPPLTTSWGPWLTGVLVVAAVGLLFVRLAGRSDRYEPRAWRRDLLVAAGLLLAACASALAWPAAVPAFWGSRRYVAENVTTQVLETALPGLGWWLALLAALLLVAAWQTARPTTDK